MSRFAVKTDQAPTLLSLENGADDDGSVWVVAERGEDRDLVLRFMPGGFVEIVTLDPVPADRLGLLRDAAGRIVVKVAP